jgi:hypothetical protein
VCDRIFDPFAQATITSFREVLGGDFSEDGAVDGDDLARWRLGVGTSGYPVHQRGDADGDLDVDGRDFSIWQRQLGMSRVAAQATPEPSAGVMGLGLAALLLWRKRGAS